MARPRRGQARQRQRVAQHLHAEHRKSFAGRRLQRQSEFPGQHLADGFAKLPTSSQYVHFTSLGCIALSTILLLTPAAYHRIVEEGEDTEHFHRFASRIVLAATVPLALGIAGTSSWSSERSVTT